VRGVATAFPKALPDSAPDGYDEAHLPTAPRVVSDIRQMASRFEVNLPRLAGLGKPGAPTRLSDWSGGKPMPRRAPKSIAIAVIETHVSLWVLMIPMTTERLTLLM
jgi:hypothetical protein